MRVLSVVHEADAGAGVFGAYPTWVPAAQPPPSIEDVDALMVFGASTHIDQEEENPWLAP